MKKVVFLIVMLLTLHQGHAQHEQEVVIQHKDAKGRQVVLAGTLTKPDGKAPRGGWPAMVLITGSGSQNRNEEVAGHQPFKVIADFMAKNGIATLRCDDRGVGGSGGVFADVTPWDLVADIHTQWQWLASAKGINAKQVGLLGHSEGGLMATLSAAQNGKVAFVVMMAGPALPMGQVLIDQNLEVFHLRGLPDTLVSRRVEFVRQALAVIDSIASCDTMQLVKRLNTGLRQLKDSVAQGLTKAEKQAIGLTTAECYGWAQTMSSPFMLAMLKINPMDYLAQVRCPIYALCGEKDCQVDAKKNLHAVRQALEGRDVVWSTHYCTDMNHLFQHCQTGGVEEYATLGQSPDNEVMMSILAWIRAEVAN